MSIKLTIFLLVILYNLITAFMKKRAKKQQEEAARNGVPAAGAGSRSGAVSTSTEEYVAKQREAPAWASQREMDEVFQDKDEAVFRPDDEEEGANPYREGDGSRPGTNRVNPANQEKPASIGKDFLTELAREIGIPVPNAPAPAPAKAPFPAKPSNAPRPAVPPRNKRVTSYDSNDHARTVADSLPGKDLTSAPGIAAVESANAAAYVTRDPSRPTALSALREDLLDGESLRRAFILKTVLDRPLALQPRVPGASEAAQSPAPAASPSA